MSIQAQVQSIIDNLTETLKDAEKVDKGNRSAATRVRKALQGVRTSCADLRKEALSATTKQG